MDNCEYNPQNWPPVSFAGPSSQYTTMFQPQAVVAVNNSWFFSLLDSWNLGHLKEKFNSNNHKKMVLYYNATLYLKL